MPFFLAGGTALGTGRGDDVVAAHRTAASSVVLVTPPFGVSTPDAYRWFDLDGPPRRGRRPRRRLPSWPAWAAELRNDLEPPVVRRHPAIARLVRSLKVLGADYAAMSGSGSAVFGVFLDAESAAGAQAALVRRGLRRVHTSTLARAVIGASATAVHCRRLNGSYTLGVSAVRGEPRLSAVLRGGSRGRRAGGGLAGGQDDWGVAKR